MRKLLLGSSLGALSMPKINALRVIDCRVPYTFSPYKTTSISWMISCMQCARKLCSSLLLMLEFLSMPRQFPRFADLPTLTCYVYSPKMWQCFVVVAFSSISCSLLQLHCLPSKANLIKPSTCLCTNGATTIHHSARYFVS